MKFPPLFTDEYLFSHLEDEFRAFSEARDADVAQQLSDWNRRDKKLTETQLDGQFVQRVFHDLWGYWSTGGSGKVAGYSLLPQYPVPGAGQSGGTGKADVALGHFGTGEFSNIAQALCEFKDIKSGLDTPQNRKGNNRSPVQQCLDYVKHSFDKAPVNSSVVPSWGIVTDMDEFRLYYRKLGAAHCQRFSISKRDEVTSLLDKTDEGAWQRFLFCKLFSYESLIARSGVSSLERLLQRQLTFEKALEKDFYKEYQAYRQHVYQSIIDANPGFAGTRGDLVRMTQRFLDRCIFLLFCEDMGNALSFPVHLLRDILIQESRSESYSSDFDNIWSLVKQLFHTMREGGPFPPDHHIHRFNGGLFAEIEELEKLRIPNRVFCAKGQGESKEKLLSCRNTLLYLSATYNFGSTSGSHERTINLYTLGRIFEQSITDLEYMHADAEGVPTVAEVSKRRRDGVYYTPEWVTSYIVEQVLGRRLAEERDRIGLNLGVEISAENILKYRKAKVKPKTNPATIHYKKIDEYELFLDRMTILDPACGSGAFLIQALQFLQRQRRDLALERERITGHPSLFDQDELVRTILSKNLFGVDINPESVEITQLALWLHTAAARKPLSTLDENIRCGNSLVEVDFRLFYKKKHSTLFEKADRKEQEKVNAFNWSAAFPKILGAQLPESERGFDCIIGNPPYVKLQHFRKVVPDVAEYLVEATVKDEVTGSTNRRYMSTQKQNFDLYLPFIERGISLLHPDGHMGFIAPSVWLLSEYGEGLKGRIISSRTLERWVDFKDFPVFDEAMTYTALQFYAGRAVAGINYASAPDGELASVVDEGFIDYATLNSKSVWTFLPDAERDLIARLRANYKSLGSVDFVDSIFVGVQTSADSVFHLTKVSAGCYRTLGQSGTAVDVKLEDGIMRPLLSGTEAKRYTSPKTDTYILFPYCKSANGTLRLYTANELQSSFPHAWAYLANNEKALRAREKGAFNDDEWYRFGRNQNIDKQHLPKLGVAQTVPEMRVFYDVDGGYCFNNVRVNGIMVAEAQAWFLLGILNSRVADFVFRRGSKPKEPRPSGAYYEANKQYIAPIPIPNATDDQQATVSDLAKNLHRLHTVRRDAIDELSRILSSDQMRPDERLPAWIWAKVRTPEDWASVNPEGLAGRKLSKWAQDYFGSLIDSQYRAIDDRISFGQPMHAKISDSRLQFYIGEICVIEVFVSELEAQIILPQWQEKARDAFVSEAMDAKRIVTRLLALKTTDNTALAAELAKQTALLESTENLISSAENQLDAYCYSLYALSDDEQRIVESVTAQRAKARLPSQVSRNAPIPVE